jgi:hypothetical protein
VKGLCNLHRRETLGQRPNDSWVGSTKKLSAINESNHQTVIRADRNCSRVHADGLMDVPAIDCIAYASKHAVGVSVIGALEVNMGWGEALKKLGES